MKKSILLLVTLHCIAADIYSQQDFEPINTGAANFLTIPSSARRSGMGGTGAAVTNNNDAIFYNAATVLSAEGSKGGATYTYSPWMRDYQSGHAIHSLGGFYKIDKQNAILGGIRYYNYPKISGMGEDMEPNKSIRPKEMSFELGYTRELLKDLYLAATFRYIYSDMGNTRNAKSSGAVAFDAAAFYKRNMNILHHASWALGLQLSNVGSKIKYLKSKEELPSMIKLGGSVDLPFSLSHRLLIAADGGYRLLPSDIQSFSFSGGAEYTCMQHFMLRGGYHYGDKNKGDFSYASAGVGIGYYGAQLNFSWLFAENDNPMKNTFQLSVGYTF